MRYLIQFAVPVIILVGVVYLLERRRKAEAGRRVQEGSGAGSDNGVFLMILALGAAVAIAVVLTLQSFWN